MSWTICINVPKDSTTVDGRRRVCLLIPHLVPPHLWTPPEPPFVSHPGFDPARVRHLQGLATIDQIAEGLPAEASRELRKSVTHQMQALGRELGEGIELARHDHAEYAVPVAQGA